MRRLSVHGAHAHAGVEREKLALFVVDGDRDKQVMAAMVDRFESGELAGADPISGQNAGLCRSGSSLSF